MFTIKNDLNGELIVNKSRFITYVYKVNNVLEVNEKTTNAEKEFSNDLNGLLNLVDEKWNEK